MTVYINCKWMAQPLTGTQRYAAEITRRLVLEKGERPILVMPSDAVVPGWVDQDCLQIRSRFRGMAFEQFALPGITRGSLLVNLGGPAPLLKVRQIATMHDASFVRLPVTYSKAFVLWYKTMYRVLSRTADHIVSVSHFSARELSDYLKVPVSSFAVVPNGSDHMDALEPEKPSLDLPEGTPFALCVGTLARHKNLEPVVRELRGAGVAVVVVGAAGKSRVFNTETGIEDDGVFVAGRISDSELKWLYERATALVFPSLYEGFGLPVVEAQRCGCPVISSGRASLREVGGDGAAYFDTNAISSVVGLFIRIRDDQLYRQELVESGFRNSARYSWGASTGSLIRIIKGTQVKRAWRRRLLPSWLAAKS